MSSGNRPGRRAFCILAVFCSLGAGAAAGDEREGSAPKTNLEVMQNLTGELTGEILGHLRPPSAADSLELLIDSSDGRWLVEQAFTAQLTAHGYKVFTAPSGASRAGTVIEVHGVGLRVRYDDLAHNGLFGPTTVTRTISAELSAQARSVPEGEVLFSGTVARSAADTIQVDDVPSLEVPAARLTHSELPPDNFINRAVEPFIIIGATGVVVYLLFHIRS